MVRGGKWFDGRRLRTIRLAQRVSQRQLGLRSGIPQPSISMFERGLSQPEPQTLLALAKALNVEPAALLMALDGPPTLARRRMEAGMIQRHVADALGIPPSTYAAIERGEVNPSPELTKRLDKLLAERAVQLRRRR